MSSAPLRSIIVDDSSPLIKYLGTWAIGNRTNSSDTIFGGPFNNTLHGLTASGNFSFNFTGSSMSVIGSFPNIRASTAPSWSCFINGFAISSSTIPGINRNNWELCALQNISTTTPTNLTVTASGSTDTPFLLDRIEYTPIASVILDNATVLVPGNDTQIQYDSGWSNFRDLGRQTSVNGSTMTFDFIGIQATWFTTIPSNPNITVNSSAQYSIDGGTFIPFPVAASSSPFDFYDQISFQTPMLLPPQSHRLVVQYRGNNETAPLILDHLVIQNLTIPPYIPPPYHPKRLSQGAIAGIVIGSLIGLFLILALIYFTWFTKEMRGKRKLAAASRRLASEEERAKSEHNQDGTD